MAAKNDKTIIPRGIIIERAAGTRFIKTTIKKVSKAMFTTVRPVFEFAGEPRRRLLKDAWKEEKAPFETRQLAVKKRTSEIIAL